MIVDIAVRRPVTVWMFTFAIILFGMVSLSKLNINLLPDLSYPTLTIRTDYVGAAPSEVEQLISKPIEEAIGIVKGVRKVQSISKAGQSDVVLEFEWGTKMDIASLEVREKLDVVTLPLDVQKPLILKFNPSLDPIMRLGFRHKQSEEEQSFASDAGNLKDLRVYAEEEIKRKIESVTGVASVKVGGGLENEIQVLIDQRKTSQLKIDIDEIVSRLREENVNTSGGRVKDGSQEYLVRTLNQFESLDEMRDLFIATRESKHIRLGDVAEVVDSHKERTSVNRINGEEAVEIALYKEGDANTVAVADSVNRRIQRLETEIPENYELVKVYDQSNFIRNAIAEVKSAAVVGGVLAMLILYLFLKNVWATFIISISIPVSIIATFNLMFGNNISLNIMSMGGIALAVGMLVDNSIVVLENIDRKKKSIANKFTAAAEGTKEVSGAITAATLTTMAVFLPLVFVEGIAGQLFSDQALTVTFALLASLIVAITLIPMLAAREKDSSNTDQSVANLQQETTKTPATGWRKWAGYAALPFKWLVKIAFYFVPLAVSTLVITAWRILGKILGFVFAPFLKVFDIVYNALVGLYAKALRTALDWKKTTIAAVLSIVAVSTLLIPKIGMELIPPMSQGEFYIELDLHSGAQLEQTDRYLQEIAEFAAKQAFVAKSYSLAGTGSLMNASPSQGGENWGRINVVMKPSSSAQQEAQTISVIRDYVADIPGVEAKFGRPELFSFSTPLEIELVAYDLGMLKRYADKMVSILAANDRFVDVKTTLQTGYPEVKVHFDHDRLAQLGLSAPQVSKLLASKIGGDVASRFSVNDRKVDILVRTGEQDRNSIADIRNIIVNPGSSTPIPLDAVADIELAKGPSEITRIGQERVAIVSANLAYGDLGEAVATAKSLIRELQAPYSIGVKVTGQNEEMDNSFNSLKFALALAIFLVYLVMASQFESLFHPFLILFTVPLAAAGSIIGLYVTSTNLSIVVFIGLIMLAGIVVNNAIVLVDRINQLRESGIEKTAAIIEAAETRFRPILMTTLTTTLGLLPLALGVGDGAEIRTPMAITVIFGLLFSTVLTLLLIPALYSQLERKNFAKVMDNNQANEEAVYE